MKLLFVQNMVLPLAAQLGRSLGSKSVLRLRLGQWFPSLVQRGVRGAGQSMTSIIIPLIVLGFAPLLAPASGCAQDQKTKVQPTNDQARQMSQADSFTIASQGRQHPSYQVFAHQATLPPVAVLSKETVAVGAVKIEVSRLNLVSIQDKQAMAGLLGVPVGVLQKVLEGLPSEAGSDPERFRQQLRTAAIDYKYLQDRWARYHPPAGKEKVKNEALMALQAGEINRVWKMFQELPRPQPPSGLRVATP